MRIGENDVRCQRDQFGGDRAIALGIAGTPSILDAAFGHLHAVAHELAFQLSGYDVIGWCKGSRRQKKRLSFFASSIQSQNLE